MPTTPMPIPESRRDVHMFRFALSCIVVLLPSFAATDEKKDPPVWTPVPFSEVRASLEKEGWKIESSVLVKFYDGEKVVSVQINGADKKVLKAGKIRQTEVVLMAPIDFLPGKTKVVRWTESPSHDERDKVVFEMARGERECFLEKGPSIVRVIGFYDEWPDDSKKPKEEAKEAPKVENAGERTLTLSSEPARITGGTMTMSLKPYEGSIRRLVYVQRRTELLDGETVIGVWYEPAFGSVTFLKKLPDEKKKAP
jgi:hypothetical protein